MTNEYSQAWHPPQTSDENSPSQEGNGRNVDAAALCSQVEDLQRELRSALNQLAASQAAVAKLSGDVSELAESLKTARTQLDAVFRSRSWRWLEPIRRANFLLKSYRKKARAGRMPG